MIQFHLLLLYMIRNLQLIYYYFNNRYRTLKSNNLKTLKKPNWLLIITALISFMRENSPLPSKFLQRSRKSRSRKSSISFHFDNLVFSWFNVICPLAFKVFLTFFICISLYYPKKNCCPTARKMRSEHIRSYYQSCRNSSVRVSDKICGDVTNNLMINLKLNKTKYDRLFILIYNIHQLHILHSSFCGIIWGFLSLKFCLKNLQLW